MSASLSAPIQGSSSLSGPGQKCFLMKPEAPEPPQLQHFSYRGHPRRLCPGSILAQRGHAFGVHSGRSISSRRSTSVILGRSCAFSSSEGSGGGRVATCFSMGDGSGTPSARGASLILHVLRPWPNWPHLPHL